jgi:hypothetical protein
VGTQDRSEKENRRVGTEAEARSARGMPRARGAACSAGDPPTTTTVTPPHHHARDATRARRLPTHPPPPAPPIPLFSAPRPSAMDVRRRRGWVGLRGGGVRGGGVRGEGLSDEQWGVGVRVGVGG